MLAIASIYLLVRQLNKLIKSPKLQNFLAARKLIQRFNFEGVEQQFFNTSTIRTFGSLHLSDCVCISENEYLDVELPKILVHACKLFNRILPQPKTFDCSVVAKFCINFSTRGVKKKKWKKKTKIKNI